ncbi:hypothetical protein Stsp02_45120 [Streptomyces sp. NBRC 14336]|nr:hypothetical protein Stsp02_45120 [Streptomyces sp. NBRC 14336]
MHPAPYDLVIVQQEDPDRVVGARPLAVRHRDAPRSALSARPCRTRAPRGTGPCLSLILRHPGPKGQGLSALPVTVTRPAQVAATEQARAIRTPARDSRPLPRDPLRG